MSAPSNDQRSTKQEENHVSVYIVDDHPPIREALTDLIGERVGMEVGGKAGTAEKAFSEIKEEKPDVAVVDISLSGGHGLDLIQNLQDECPAVKTIIFSMYEETVYAERAIRAGASGYVQKSEPVSSVLEAIQAVERGEVYLSERMRSRVLRKVARKGDAEPECATDKLTDREMAVFQMLGEGDSLEEIAGRLGLSRKTVQTHRRRAKEKLGFDSVPDLLQYAVQWRGGEGTHGRGAEAKAPRPPAAPESEEQRQ